MVAATQDLPQKSLQIKEDDKFFSRLMSKETSAANSSCRVYYGGASGAIPFTWESQPGTPKHPMGEITLPPLTPPPSYQSSLATSSSSSKACIQRKAKNGRNIRLMSSIFTRFDMKKSSHVSPTFSSWSSTSSSSSSSTLSSPSSTRFRKTRHFPSLSRVPIRYDVDDDGHDDHDDDRESDRGRRSPTSTLCFGANNNINKKKKSKSHGGGCYSMVNMKNALLSIVGS